MNEDPNANDLVRAVTEARFGHLEHRNCTADAPMQKADKDKYRWHHADAKVLHPYFNLLLCQCPHCNHTFTCLPPAS